MSGSEICSATDNHQNRPQGRVLIATDSLAILFYTSRTFYIPYPVFFLTLGSDFWQKKIAGVSFLFGGQHSPEPSVDP